LTAAAPDNAPDPTEVAVETADAPVAASDLVTPPGRLTLQGDGPGLPAATDGVRINRPGAEPAAELESAAEPAAAADPAPGMTPSGPALILHAAPFDNPAALAELAIILIDAGDMAGAAAAVAAIGFPVTIAIDPGRPGAAADMAVYRAQGREVMMLARLPVGARPVDVAVVFEAAFATLPETVAVLDAGDGGLTARSAITQQALTRLAQDGRGLVVMGGGLNGIDRDAAQAGVPAATILRDLDGEGQDARVIRRFLDDAAFRARQQGQAIILGRVRPDTLSTLLLWGAADRAGQVALAPVSALLQAAVQ